MKFNKLLLIAGIGSMLVHPAAFSMDQAKLIERIVSSVTEWETALKNKEKNSNEVLAEATRLHRKDLIASKYKKELMTELKRNYYETPVFDEANESDYEEYSNTQHFYHDFYPCSAHKKCINVHNARPSKEIILKLYEVDKQLAQKIKEKDGYFYSATPLDLLKKGALHTCTKHETCFLAATIHSHDYVCEAKASQARFAKQDLDVAKTLANTKERAALLESIRGGAKLKKLTDKRRCLKHETCRKYYHKKRALKSVESDLADLDLTIKCHYAPRLNKELVELAQRISTLPSHEAEIEVNHFRNLVKIAKKYDITLDAKAAHAVAGINTEWPIAE